MISEFPLFAFTTLGGMAAGSYVFAAAFPIEEKQKRPWLLPVACLVFLGAGGLLLLTHLGHPERLLNAFANPRAGIAQEAYTMIAFGVTVVVDAVFCFVKGSSPRWLRVASAACAVLMMIAMGVAYFSVSGMAPWASWETIALFLTGDIAMGSAFYALCHPRSYRKAPYSGISTAVGFAAAAVMLLASARFSACGYSATPFVVGAVLELVGVVLIAVAWRGRFSPRIASAAAFVFIFAATAIARYAFYAVNVA